jgi:hypothetical protein
MSATEATAAVSAPAEEVKVVETPVVEPTPEAPAAEEAVPATVNFFNYPLLLFRPSLTLCIQEAPKEEAKADVSCLHPLSWFPRLTRLFRRLPPPPKLLLMPLQNPPRRNPRLCVQFPLVLNFY